MRVVVVYKYESDHAREVLDYLRDFSRQTGHTIKEIDPEAFISMGSVMGVYGQGFEKLKL